MEQELFSFVKGIGFNRPDVLGNVRNINSRYEAMIPVFENELRKRNLEIQYSPISIPMVLAKCYTHESINNRGVLLTGCTGCGKTERMKLLARLGMVTMIDADQLCIEVSRKEKLQDKRELYNYPTYGNCGLRDYDLIIDDLGSEEQEYCTYGNREDVMSFILRERYLVWKNHHFLTSATTNLSVPQLKKRYGEREFSRMAEMFAVVNLEGKDRRLESNKTFQF